jgi:excisionase family DNA binding protein
MPRRKYMTIPELANRMGVSRIAIYNRVRKGQIHAMKIGKTYIITDRTITDILAKKTSGRGKKRIDAAVHRTVQEYGEVLKKLGRE